MGSPTIGQQTAATLGFIAMVMLLGPLVSVVSPTSFQASYFGANGIANSTYANFNTKFEIPVLQTANSTTGFQAAGNLLNSAFSPLAFIYGALGLFWKSFTNMPTMLYIIFTSTGSNLLFVPIAAGTIFTIITFAYISVGNFYKFLSMWQKSDAENVGS